MGKIKKFYLNDVQIKKALSDICPGFNDICNGAKSVRVYVHIGGGGDYSDMDYDIDTSDPVIVEIET